MSDKNTKFFDSGIPLSLTKEMKTSLNPNIEFLKIINLIKNKHLKIERDDLSKIKSSFANELISIKNSARIINIKIKKNFFLINSIIKNQEDEIQLLHQEKKILNHNKIQSNIIYSQKILIDNFKQSIEELKFNLYQLEKKLKESVNSNKNFETNNNKLNNNISLLITANEKLKDTIKKFDSQQTETSLSLVDKNELLSKIKFYQEENIRLSSELNSTQERYEAIKNNFDEVELEKNNIYKQIKELNNSLIKTNVIGTPFLKDIFEEGSINSKVLNEISNTNFQEENKTKEKNKNLEDKIFDIFE
jgi:hypothetical protein